MNMNISLYHGCNQSEVSVDWGEPLPSDPNVNFVCLSVCLYMCHGSALYKR